MATATKNTVGAAGAALLLVAGGYYATPKAPSSTCQQHSTDPLKGGRCIPQNDVIEKYPPLVKAAFKAQLLGFACSESGCTSVTVKDALEGRVVGTVFPPDDICRKDKGVFVPCPTKTDGGSP